MPFMKGIAPIRRTKQYLEAGKLIMKPEIRVMTLNFNVDQTSSSGAYEFMKWHLPQLKFKNPALQIVKFKNMTPTPFMQIFFDNGEKVLVDLYGRSRVEIHDHLWNTFCLSEEEQREREQRRLNPANFGSHCNRWCICEVPGQVPCPGFQPLPKSMRGKYRGKTEEELEGS
ncbi:28S ribosomal protein S25 [Mactra antiquata]